VCHMTGSIVNVSDSFVSLDVCDDIRYVIHGFPLLLYYSIYIVKSSWLII
jgi:hypothetical protein